MDIKIASYLDVKVPFQGSREEKNGLIIIEKSKGNAFNSENRNKEGEKIKMKSKENGMDGAITPLQG